MIRKIALASALTFSFNSFAADDKREGTGPNCQPESKWSQMTDKYVNLILEYREVANDDSLSHEQKTEMLQSISEEMSHEQDGQFLNKDYNDCMRESNKQQDKDYERCDKNGSGDKCYDRADKNNDNRRAACERVSHSDNATRAASDIAGGKKSDHISSADRRR